jgi:hypothetical protein
MNKMLALIAHGLLVTGMIYALVAILAMPAAACTTSECNTIHSNAGNICRSFFGPNCTMGNVLSCNANGFSILCRNQGGGVCGTIGSQCG